MHRTRPDGISPQCEALLHAVFQTKGEVEFGILKRSTRSIIAPAPTTVELPIVLQVNSYSCTTGATSTAPILRLLFLRNQRIVRYSMGSRFRAKWVLKDRMINRGTTEYFGHHDFVFAKVISCTPIPWDYPLMLCQQYFVKIGFWVKKGAPQVK